ncbi:MAG TPA: alpha/beta hydrolase [Syntrophales bacterium]|nr:alpha/beta hydrolase [Syntrophales bacterium]
MDLTRVFIHGLESSSQGTKGVFFRERYPDMIIEDFVGTFEQRMEKLYKLLSDKADLILVGSSYGGLMAAVYAFNYKEKIRKLILLAPALNIDEFKPYLNRKLCLPVMIYHGRNDDVVPPLSVRNIAVSVFTNLQHFLVDDDHSLHDTFSLMDWDALLDI